MGQCEKQGIKVKPIIPSKGYSRARTVQEIDELDAKLSEIEGRMSQMNASYDTMSKRFLELTEMKHVLRETAFVFDEV